jgi:hypothetical protein
MFRLNVSVVATAIALAFSTAALAQGMSKDDYKAATQRISADGKVARTNCDSLSANAKDICVAEAKGAEAIAKAELEARNKPSVKARYDVRVAKAQADYSIAREKCDDMAGNAKDVCVKEAKAAEVAAKADATAERKSADANKMSRETSSDARKEAASEKRDADYAVAVEKCDTYAGGAKDYCVQQAKVRFGKS